MPLTASSAPIPTPIPAAARSPAVPPTPHPVRISIPAIDVTSELLELGLNPDNTVAVPAPGPDYDKAAWFTGSPLPGDVGLAVIEGHVDSAANGPSVFFQLGALVPGNDVEVARADDSTLRYLVDSVRSFPKDNFPTLEVYGNTAGPELRLVTCGGEFDADKHSYLNDTVVFAHLAV